MTEVLNEVDSPSRVRHRGTAMTHQCRKRAVILLSRLLRHGDCNCGRNPALSALMWCAVAFTDPEGTYGHRLGNRGRSARAWSAHGPGRHPSDDILSFRMRGAGGYRHFSWPPIFLSFAFDGRVSQKKFSKKNDPIYRSCD